MNQSWEDMKLIERRKKVYNHGHACALCKKDFRSSKDLEQHNSKKHK